MIQVPSTRAILLLALLSVFTAATGLADTGITQSDNLNQNGPAHPQSGFPSQDAETGRYVQDTQARLAKAGDGQASFDYTKLDGNGQPLPSNAANWDCVRDNVTGLEWEIKTADGGLQDKDWTYTWYNPDNATNGGNAGSTGSNTCSGTLPGGQCNTLAYAVAVNSLPTPLCGHADWRLPSHEELRSIVDYSVLNPAITVCYFPRTVSNSYWSASSSAANAGDAWSVGFNGGGAFVKGAYHAVRLVRGGQ